MSFADVAADVVDALQALDLDDLDAGPRPGGYVEPSEAAWSVIERVATPYLHDLERRVKLRHEDQALEVCSSSWASIARSIAASNSSNMQRTARRNLPATLWRSGAADAATAHSRATSSRSTRQIGHGSFADETTAALFKAAALNCPVGACTTHVPVVHFTKSFIYNNLKLAERVGFEPKRSLQIL